MRPPAGLRRSALLLFDFSRGRQALLSVTQPALGALLAAGGLPSGRVIGLGLVAAGAGFLSVFAANDLYDRRADAVEVALRADRPSAKSFDVDVVSVRHPLAAGQLPLWLGITWVAGLGLAGFAAAWALRPLCALVFLACNLLEFIYCSLRKRSWSKTIPAGIMVGLGGLAGWFAVAGPSWGALAFFLLLTTWEIAGRNLSNDLADLSGDGAVGITTVATIFGPATSANWILLGAVAMPLLAALQPGGLLLRLSLAAGAVALMTIPAVRLKLTTSETQAQIYFNRASLYPAAAFAAAAITLSLGV
ncbi:MAG TPA: UbiA prenyltransferase family protein [Thermoleophilia bacterium]|nr:UbiA prenyltransferase family protein [Thermoleophilia bacterium]